MPRKEQVGAVEDAAAAVEAEDTVLEMDLGRVLVEP
jgi:hypothetical protein